MIRPESRGLRHIFVLAPLRLIPCLVFWASSAVAQEAVQQLNPVRQVAPHPEIPGLTVKDGRLSLRVRDYPLEDLLEPLSQKAYMSTIAPEGLGGARVTIELKDVPLDEGIRQILKNHDAFLFYSPQTGSRAERDSSAVLRVIWVYPKGRGWRLQPFPPEQWASTKELEGKLDDADPEVRSQALLAMIERKGAAAMDALLRALREDRDDKVRRRALDAALRKNLDLPPGLLQALVATDRSEVVRFLALEALQGDPNMKAIAEQRFLLDPDPNVKARAEQILRLLDASSQPPAGEKPVQGQRPQTPVP